jgi:tRNA 5-methylaminomethyl-2-thiouridine biosynthesis bifunctional protein
MLVAEHVASELEGEPLPLERDLADAIRAGRFKPPAPDTGI